MKERPMIFNDAMVRAILDGMKTQMRRPIKNCMGAVWPATCIRGYLIGKSNCPYGQPADRLWVRECFALTGPELNDQPGFVYRATDPDWQIMEGFRWTPSIQMPRIASRITLEIVSVRVERVQDISEADALAEGCDGDCPIGYIPAHSAAPYGYHFAQLWDSIYGTTDYAWTANPWVWVVEFRRVQQ